MSGYKKWFVVVGLLIGVLLEVTVIPSLRFLAGGFEVLFLFAVYFGYRFGSEYGFGLGLVAGYLKDMFSCGIIGANAFSFSICAFILAQISVRFYQEWFLSKFMTIFFVSLLHHLLYYLFSRFFTNLPGYFSTFKEFSLKPALLTALLGPALFFLLDNIFKSTPRFYQERPGIFLR